MFFGSIASVLPRLRPIACTGGHSLRRSPAMPELPTLDELGFSGFVPAWFG